MQKIKNKTTKVSYFNIESFFIFGEIKKFVLTFITRRRPLKINS
jgi:hypothetical protein